MLENGWSVTQVPSLFQMPSVLGKGKNPPTCNDKSCPQNSLLGVWRKLMSFSCAGETLKAFNEIIPPQNPYGEAEVGASAVASLENASIASCAAHTPIT